MITIDLSDYKRSYRADTEMIIWLVNTYGVGGWLLTDLNHKKIKWAWETIKNRDIIAFTTEQDATLFKLRWL